MEDVLLRLGDDGAGVDGDDFGSACARAEHAEDAGTAADIQHGLAGEEVLVVVDEVSVCVGAHCIFEHCFVNV